MNRRPTQPLHAALFCALSLALLPPCTHAQQPAGGRPNLLKNASFEEGQAGWELHSAHKRGKCALDTTQKHDGKTSLRLDNPAGEDTFLKETVSVKPGTRYRLTGYIRTKNVLVKGSGATLSLEGGYEKTESIAGSKGWTKVSFEFDSGAVATIKIGPRLGHHSAMAMGTAWFDDLTLVELGPSRKR